MTKAPEVPKSELQDSETKKPEQDKSSASRAAGLEVPDRQHRRRDEDATSSRHRRGGSSAGDALSRKNSMSSSVAAGNMGGVGGMRGLNKKITSLQKDLETFKAGIDETKGMFSEVHAEIGKIFDKIAAVRSRCEEIEDNRQKMEISFIKALRRSGKDKKTPVKATVETLSSKDLKKIYSELSQKSSKIGSIETVLEKVSLDMKFVKSQFQSKLNEVIVAVHSFENYRKDLTKDSSILEGKVRALEDQFLRLSFSIHSEVENIKGPMNDLISDQQREKEILEENLKRQRQGFQEILQDSSVSVKNLVNESVVQSRITTTRPRTRKSNESPKVSLKHKFFEGNNSFRQSNPLLKAEENWLSGFPDGKTLALPKVGVKKSKVSLSIDEPRKSL
jgi:septation ring formation regulator EzrA